MPGITISKGKAELAIRPDLGGGVSRFNIAGFDVLRPAAPETDDVLGLGSFPLVPVVNRIPDGAFQFMDHAIKLPPNTVGEPDYLHGDGWQSTWDIAQWTDDQVTLHYRHPRSLWPWTYWAEQRFDIREDGCRFTLRVHNLDQKPMPCGLGFHPYFVKTEKVRLKTSYQGYWEVNHRLHPILRVPGSFRKNWVDGDSLIDDATTDHTFYGFSGHASIMTDGGPDIVLTTSATCRHVHIFNPADEDFICVEPVTDRADPFGEDPRTIKILGPGEEHQIWVDIAVKS